MNTLEADTRAADIVRGVVLSERLSKLVKKEKLKQVKLTAEDKEELNRLVMSQPSLKKKLDLKAAYRMPPGEMVKKPVLEERAGNAHSTD